MNDESNVAVLFVDVDDFKSVNDTLGHYVGDEVLVAVGERLASALRSPNAVYRSGGDEFLVIARDIGDVEAADIVAGQICGAMSEPCRRSGTPSGRPSRWVWRCVTRSLPDRARS